MRVFSVAVNYLREFDDKIFAFSALAIFRSKHPVRRPIPSQLHLKERITSNHTTIYINFPTILYSLRTTTLTFSCSLQKPSISSSSKEARINTLVLDFTNSSILTTV